MRLLKSKLQEKQGVPAFVQQLFLVSKNSDGPSESKDMAQEPMDNADIIEGPCCVALCVIVDYEDRYLSLNLSPSLSLGLRPSLSLNLSLNLSLTPEPEPEPEP